MNEKETLIDHLFSIQRLILKFSQQYEINGVFYYAHQSFFHCLEGDADVIDILLSKLEQLQILYSCKHVNAVDTVSYSSWSMRYVTKDSEIFEFLKARNLNKFQPLALDSSDREKLVTVIEAQYTTNKVKSKKGYKVRGYKAY
ncbi:BLUF domain-containing protein [Acinetobacter rathckeae]|uniref:BLUF domain-containing protein n=1 Tax=Acinetobacter rathckeae TaxID=2605272 RepID=UPI0018A26579|nr:BLUF domain-containing protein [Acinetobacter rathckeae]MBF7688139.1 BLUF domain-containing protein [Acinetobacter rathckeae]